MPPTSTKLAWLTNFLPTSGGWFVVWFLLLILYGCPQLLLNDGAVARHFMTGAYILQNHTIPTSNYVWAIDPRASWLTHEFFGDIAFGGAYLGTGLNGVVLIGALVVATSLMWSYQIARWRGIGKFTGWFLLFPVMIATSLHWLSRSHIFSYICMMIIYHLTFVAPPTYKWRLAISAITMVVWTNFHGSFAIGLFILGIQPALELIKALSIEFGGSGQHGSGQHGRGDALASPRSRAARFIDHNRDLLKDISIPVISALALGLNPRGLEIFGYLFGYLSHKEIIGKGSEWRAIDLSQGIGVHMFLLTCVLLLGLWAASRRLPKLGEVIVVSSLMVAGFFTMRLIPYFALLALPAMAPSVEALRQRILAKRPTGVSSAEVSETPAASHTSAASEASALSSASTKSAKPVLVQAGVKLVLITAMCVGFLVTPMYRLKDFPAQKLPVSAVDYAVSHKLANGLAFSFDNWGPYLYYKLGQPIYIDDKTDFYPGWFMEEYHSTYAASNDWQAVLDKYKVQYAVLPPSAPLAKAMEHSKSWRQAFSDGTSKLFVRSQI